MKEETKARIVAVFLFLSIVSILIMSFIDYHEGLQIFQLGNPFIDEDWILTITSIIVLVISLKNLSFILGKLDMRRKGEEEKISELAKEGHFYILLMGLYLLMAVIAFIDLKEGVPILKKHFIDTQLRKDEDTAIAIISLISFMKFFLDYKRLVRKATKTKNKVMLE